MTPQQIVGMAARLFSIWLVVVGLQIFGIATLMSTQMGDSSSNMRFLMPGVVLLLAVFLWMFPMFIAHKIVPRTHEENILRLPAREATAAGAAIIGIWILISALPHLAGVFGLLFYGSGTAFLSEFFTQERTIEYLTIAIQCVFGLTLVFNPWFVARKVFPAPAKSAGDAAE
jgi:hypothetical protein